MCCPHIWVQKTIFIVQKSKYFRIFKKLTQTYIKKLHPNHTPISAVIIANNAARTIGQVIAAMHWCDEVLVVDSGSTDNTVEICKALGCTVIYHAFEGFGKQKYFAVSQAKNDWVWVIDSDEVATKAIVEEACNKINAGAYIGFTVPISLVFMGKLLRFGNEYKKPHLRLFNKKYGNYNDSLVHEDVTLNGSVGKLQNEVLHYSYYNIDDYFKKFNTYTTRAAQQMHARNKKMNIFFPIIKLPFHFVILYIFKGLIFDGIPGLLWATFSCWYSFVKYIKLWEMNRYKKTNQ